MRPPYLVLLLVVFATAGLAVAQAVTRTYVGPANGNWSDPDNWSPEGAPDFGDSVNVSGTVALTFDENAGYFDDVTFGSDVTYYQSNGTLAANSIGFAGTGYQSGGSLEAPNVNFSGTYTLSGNGMVGMDAPGNISVDGTFYQEGGDVENGADGVEINGAYYLSGGEIIGDGTFVDPGATLIQTGGTLTGNEDTQVTGTAAAPATVYLSGGNFTDLYEIMLSGTTDFYQSGGTMDPLAISIGTSVGDNVNYSMTGGQIHTTSAPNSFSLGAVFFCQSGGVVDSEGGMVTTANTVYQLTSGELYVFDFTNGGQFTLDSHPAAPLTAPTISGSYFRQSSVGEISLLDLQPDEVPLLTFDHSASLGGTLSITLDPSYMPVIGDAFVLIGSPRVTGTFADYDFPVLAGGLYFEPVYTATEMELVVVPEPAVAMLLVGLALTSRRPRRQGSGGLPSRKFA